MARILVIDDQPMVLKCVKSALGLDGHDIATVCAADLAIKLLETMSFDIVITDYAMPRMDGIQFLHFAREKIPDVPVIMITGYGTTDTAIEAMTQGAFDYLPKPFSLKDLRETVNNANQYVVTKNTINDQIAPKPECFRFTNIVAASSVMSDVCDRVLLVARNDSPVMIVGQHGTGKELIARTIHAQSPNNNTVFLTVRVADIPAEETMNQLLQKAWGGTLFLQDIGELPPDLQTELSEILMKRTLNDDASETCVPLNVRIIASSSEPLDPALTGKEFNVELLRQINYIEIPPLRRRVEDIRIHVGRVLKRAMTRSGNPPTIDPKALLVLENCAWPKNIPELEQTIENACIVAGEKRINISHLPPDLVAQVPEEKLEIKQSFELNDLKGQAVRNYLKDKGLEFQTLISQINAFSN